MYLSKNDGTAIMIQAHYVQYTRINIIGQFLSSIDI